MDVEGYPYQGATSNRKPRYLGSLTSHCKNLGNDIIVYTHEKSLKELEDLKEKHELNNLTIKILELSDMKLHKRISEVRNIKFDHSLDGRGPEIMWGKFDVLEREINDTDQIFWIDVGLQHPGIIPWMYCLPYHDKVKYHDPCKLGILPYWHHNQESQYNFKLLLDDVLINKLKNITNDKMFVITTNNPQTNYQDFLDKNIVNNINGPYLIAGMFGGDSNIVKDFINNFWNISNKVLDNNFLVTEESIMKIVYDSMDKNIFLPFEFSVHATDQHDEFHFSLWNETIKKPKPLYMIFHDILNY